MKMLKLQFLGTLVLMMCMVIPAMAQTANSLVLTFSVDPSTTYNDGTVRYSLILTNQNIPGANPATVDITFSPPGPTGANGAFGTQVTLDTSITIPVGTEVVYNYDGSDGAIARPVLEVDLGAVPLNPGVTVAYAQAGFDGIYNASPEYNAIDSRTVPVTVISPDTLVNISTSAAQVVSGGTVDLTVTEQNTGDDPLDSPYVEVSPGGYTLNKASTYYVSGDTNGDGILDTTETWTWIITGVVVNADTTFTAIGHGTDSLGNDITYDPGPPEVYPGEKATVDVDAISPDTLVNISTSAAQVVS
ncbi:hypothetical protein ACFL5Z_06475, partial [Planctomycetota bacterium]